MMGLHAPYALWTQGLQTGLLLWDAQLVVALRVMGLAGLRPLPSGEAYRMVAEKPPAFAQAWLGWHRALVSGRDLHAQNRAFTRPLSRKARANRKRLMQ